MRWGIVIVAAWVAGCAAGPPPVPPAVELLADPDASFVEATARTRIALIGKDWAMQAWLPLDRVPLFRVDVPTVDVRLRAERAIFYPGPEIPELRPSRGPPDPPPDWNNPDYRPPPEVQVPEVWVRLSGPSAEQSSERRLEVTLSEFTVDGRRHALPRPLRLQIRGPYP